MMGNDENQQLTHYPKTWKCTAMIAVYQLIYGSRMVKLPFWKMRSSQICRFRLTGVSIRFTDVLKQY